MLEPPGWENGGRGPGPTGLGEDGIERLTVGVDDPLPVPLERLPAGVDGPLLLLLAVCTERLPAGVDEPLPPPPVTVRPKAESRSMLVGGRCSSDLKFKLKTSLKTKLRNSTVSNDYPGSSQDQDLNIHLSLAKKIHCLFFFKLHT